MLIDTSNRLSLAMVAAVAFTAAIAHADTPANVKSQLFHNEDCDAHFDTELALSDGGKAVDGYVDLVASGGVTAFLLNTNCSRANYDSEAWEPAWAAWKDTSAVQWPAGIRALHALHRQGIDYPARVIDRCRHHGIAPWISLRMNDVHYQLDKPDDAIHSDFWRNNPQLRRRRDAGIRFGSASASPRGRRWR